MLLFYGAVVIVIVIKFFFLSSLPTSGASAGCQDRLKCCQVRSISDGGWGWGGAGDGRRRKCMESASLCSGLTASAVATLAPEVCGHPLPPWSWHFQWSGPRVGREASPVAPRFAQGGLASTPHAVSGSFFLFWRLYFPHPSVGYIL